MSTAPLARHITLGEFAAAVSGAGIAKVLLDNHAGIWVCNGAFAEGKTAEARGTDLELVLTDFLQLTGWKRCRMRWVPGLLIDPENPKPTMPGRCTKRAGHELAGDYDHTFGADDWPEFPGGVPRKGKSR